MRLCIRGHCRSIHRRSRGHRIFWPRLGSGRWHRHHHWFTRHALRRRILARYFTLVPLVSAASQRPQPEPCDASAFTRFGRRFGVRFAVGCRTVAQPLLMMPRNTSVNFPEFFQQICQRAQSEGIVALPMAERHILAVAEFLCELNCGGIHQYFANSAGDHLSDLLSGLDALGCAHERALVVASLSIFGEAGYSPDRQARQPALFPTDPEGDIDDEAFDRQAAILDPLKFELQDRVEYIGQRNEEYARAYASIRKA